MIGVAAIISQDVLDAVQNLKGNIKKKIDINEIFYEV